MNPNCWSLARAGLIAVGLTTVFAAPTVAAPLTPLNVPAASVASDVVPVARRCRGGNDHCISRHSSKRSHYRRHRHDDDRWRRYRHRGPSIYFNFSVPSYRYYEPYYAPRRVYRSHGLSQAHIAWCYDRYRSYRHWDNSYQPYHGPRKQCWSPYS